MAVRLGKGLGQRLNDLEVIAVGGADCDPKGHWSHRKIIAARQRTGDGGFGGSLNSRPLVIDLANSRLRSGFICRGGQLDIIANFEPARSYIGVMVTGRLQKGHFGSNRHCSMLR
jgi:hypothetical protein